MKVLFWMPHNLEGNPSLRFVADLLPGINGRIELILQNEYPTTANGAIFPLFSVLFHDVPRCEGNGKGRAWKHCDPTTGASVPELLRTLVAVLIAVAVDECGEQTPDPCLAVWSAVAVVGGVPGRCPNQLDSQLFNLSRQRSLTGMVEVMHGAVIVIIDIDIIIIIDIDIGMVASAFVTEVACAVVAATGSFVVTFTINPSTMLTSDLMITVTVTVTATIIMATTTTILVLFVLVSRYQKYHNTNILQWSRRWPFNTRGRSIY